MSILTWMGSLLGCTAQTSDYASVGVAEFEQCIANDSVIRLDVRTSSEYAEGHLPDAINVDVQQEDFLQQAKRLLPLDRTIALYCRSGRRSKRAADLLTKEGYRVVELNTGYIGWDEAEKPVNQDEIDAFVTDKGTLVSLYCIKHGTLRARIGDKWLYVDPVGKAIPPVTDYTQLPKADVILVTHEHHDHLDAEAIKQLSKPTTTLIVNARCHELLDGQGEVMRNGEERVLEGGWQLSAVPAYNSSADKQQFHPKGRDNGYVLTVEGLRIYIAGDTEDIPEMAGLKDVDVAFLPCNLPFTMSPEQLARAARTVQPKVLFPYHYGQTDIDQTAKLLEGSGIDVRIRQYQ